MNTINILLICPIILPLITAFACMFLEKSVKSQQILSLISAATLLFIAGRLIDHTFTGSILSSNIGNWPAPFNVTLVIDRLSAIMVFITAVIHLATTIYSFVNLPNIHRKYFYPIYHVLIMGICGSFITGDLFNLYVWYEVMLMSSFVLMVLGNTRSQLKATVKYLFTNLLGSAFFLMGIGMIYRLTGTLNMADIAHQLQGMDNNSVQTWIAMMFILAFGIKAAIFPLYFWLPDSYHTPPITISAVFAGLLTKVGVYSIIRAFTLLFQADFLITHYLLEFVACGTMLFGVFGAVAQMDFRRLLSFHIISQVGYMILGISLGTEMALAGAIFYLIHHIIVKSNLFFICGLTQRLCDTTNLTKLGGIYNKHRFLSLLFLIPALSLAGFPPLSGFFAKFFIIDAGVEAYNWIAVGTALFVGLLTLFSMNKIWVEVFWKDMPPTALPHTHLSRIEKIGYYIPIIGLALITICIGFWAEPFGQIAHQTAIQLLNPSEYISSVLGGPL